MKKSPSRKLLTILWLIFYFEYFNADIISIDYFKNEHENVVNNCKQNLECHERLTYKFDEVESTEDNFKILENFYADYWKKISCQTENEPCGIMWGQCCSNMICQYFSDQLEKNNVLNEEIGLCSDPYIKYSI